MESLRGFATSDLLYRLPYATFRLSLEPLPILLKFLLLFQVSALFALLPAIAMADSLFWVVATAETEPSPYRGDSVDDVTIWIDDQHPEDSLILATLKASNQKPVKPTGILVYDLSGKQIQFIPGGTPNNIDIRYGFSGIDAGSGLVAVSNWWSNDVYFYQADKTGVKRIFDPAPTNLSDLRGICLHRTQDGDIHYFVFAQNGHSEQYRLDTLGVSHLVREFKLATTAEGCVVDDKTGALYVSEERKAIWRFSTENMENPPIKIFKTSLFGPLRADVEGLALYTHPDGSGYLIASSQGNSTYLIFDRNHNRLIGRFKVKEDTYDTVTGSDGLITTSRALGDQYPAGVFIAQDHQNHNDGRLVNQNFKLVDWQNIEVHLTK
ncbi:MAG TPA: hypothetical protein DCM54_11735 [Gammaproteobacteria bacterium]|nr:hypothetical protein [Gammaproteobacteria bacterium]